MGRPGKTTRKDATAAHPDEAMAKPNKRQKAENGAASSHEESNKIINQKMLEPESRAAIREAYANAQPYTHTVLQSPFDPELLRKVRDEVVNNIQATYKETDLFKVFQTGDLGNLDKLDKDIAKKLPTLMRLKEALYSPEFRAFVREITGCGELSEKTDCSCNVYANGGHLLVHDDVIGTRRVSYIIYLTDPEDPWKAEDGGALELYPLVEGQNHIPEVFPTVCHLPQFNTMGMFTVLPGKSFHAVQEVFAVDKPRMSISGWYHGPHAPEDADKASLQQLQSLTGLPGQDDAGKTYGGFDGSGSVTPCRAPPGCPALLDLSDADLAALVRYLNPTYLSEDAWPRIHAKFAEDGSIQLQNFLKRSVAERITAALVREDLADGLGGGKVPDYRAGVRDGWSAVGPSHKQRYLRYDGTAGTSSSTDSCGALLAQVRDELFKSGAFARLLKKMTTITLLGHRSEVRRFRPGLDYTVAHYGLITKDPRLDVVLCFVDTTPTPASGSGSGSGADEEPSTSGKKSAGAAGKKGGAAAKAKGKQEAAAAGKEGSAGGVSEDKALAWDAGEVGGFEAYLLAEEDAEGTMAEDTYRVEQDESGVLNVSAAANSLNLVLRDEGLMKFVKYLSYAAPGSRWDIAMEYLPEDDSDDEEQEEEDAKVTAKEEVKQKVVVEEEEERCEEAKEEKAKPGDKNSGKKGGSKGGKAQAVSGKKEAQAPAKGKRGGKK
mmetsp:Transcript_31041/g.68891  ORF Transcript_31041/g.68891 Transcript_31041/m.68891 type:complete len:719 (-) Transcript_31041:853-3009(-)|eukprot:CAMPEP_0202902666 /NCGR_PEP_ID=MMETSP1392-20130828/16985_1 /ASSEMBLY_ACC=CAM_ASM_000868 /TAXON_ID=225041 /ORGANISM="Chlamydomonas chlamydogama, Strain SAG 11-48b" /LENGTH=718 /DNA_ID=CAMNT_0049589465 /DNA_START=69 /DNA_END=2225 /DNA_ORIENTATION=+